MKKISVISGGSGGLGLEIASLLVRSGRNVVILGRNNEKLLSASDKLKQMATGNQTEAIICNIGNDCDIK